MVFSELRQLWACSFLGVALARLAAAPLLRECYELCGYFWWGAALVVLGGPRHRCVVSCAVRTRCPERIRAADKRVLAVDASSEAVLSRRAVAQLALTLSREQGFLSDPYKLVWVASEANTAPDRRPRERDALALALRARYHLGGGQALHLEWAHSRDDWELRSHTLSLRLQALAGERGRVAFGLRWYSQSQAAFYAPFFTTRPDSGEQSSDPRLAPFGALAVQLDLQRPLGDWRIGGGVEAYAADADYALREVAVEAPGLTRYWSAYLSLGRRW